MFYIILFIITITTKLTIELLVVTMETSTDWLDKFSKVLVIT